MSNLPDFDRYGYKVIRELGHNYVGGRITYLATYTTERPPLAPSPGKGGYGKVPVVIKQFQFAKSASDWSGFKAYEREIQVLQGLNHPGIPRYLDSFETPDGFCMVQEYKNAQPLSVPRNFEPDDIKQIAVSVLEILVYLQQRIPPVIHRDIKPENILVDEQLNVYLVDFGFAKIGGGEVAISSVVAGTLGFMPPEQLYNRQLTPATDLYSLGMTLICLLTRTKSTAIETLIDNENRINFKHLLPKLSPRLIDWLEKMVQTNPQNRYANAAAALSALKPIDVIRIPQVDLSQSSLEFRATKLGEKLTQTITISNPVAETLLSGNWEVAPNLNDPPHTPDAHAWIAFNPAKFASNRVKCQITVDTSKLLADKTYRREILLHTNSSPETRALSIKVRTAPIPFESKILPLALLALLFGVSLAGATEFGVVAGFGLLSACILGFIEGIIGFLIYIIKPNWSILVTGGFLGVVGAIVSIWVTGSSVPENAVGYGVQFGAIITAWGAVTTAVAVAENLQERKFSTSHVLSIPLLTVALGFALGIAFTQGFVEPLVNSAVLATGLPLGTMVFYPRWQQRRLIAKYRESEQHLIKP